METQMYPGYGISQSNMYQGPAPAMFFNHKAEKIDWRRIAAVDLNRITKELDFTALQDTISSIAFCEIEHELDSRYIEPNYVRLFKLAQLQIQYLLYSQDYLTGSLSTEAEKGQAAMDELEKVRRDLAGLRERQVELKKQCHRYKKMVRIQQMLMPSSHDLHHPCPHCDKKFISRDFLANHLERRHKAVSNQAVHPVVSLSPGSNSKDVEELREQLKLKSTEIDILRQQMLQGGNVGGENIDLSGLRHDMMRQHKEEMDALKNMFMEELKDLNSKYLSSEKALQELRVKQNQGSRSNLGELEDDDDALKLQKEQEAKLAEENRKLMANIAREKAISEKRKIDLERQRAEFENRIMEAREHAQNHRQNQNQSQSLIHESSMVSDLEDSEITPVTIPQPFIQSEADENSTPKQRTQIENESLLKKKRQKDDEGKDEDLIERRTAAIAAATASKNNREFPPSHPQTVPSKFEPEDTDEDLTEDESESILVSKEMKKTLADTGPMGTGEMSPTSSWDISQLRSSRVMEKLKAEPKLLQSFIRQLEIILEEKLMDLGVDKNAKRLTTPVLNEKLAILRKERDQLTRKHVQFAAIRQQYVKEVEKDARERLRGPPEHKEQDNRARSQSNTLSPSIQRSINGPRPPPRPSPQADRRSATLPIPSPPNENRPQPSAPAPPLVPSLRQRDLESESESDESYSAIGEHNNSHTQPFMNGVQPTPPPPPEHDNDVRPSPRKPRQHRPLSASNGLNKLDSPESITDWDTVDGRKHSLQGGGDIVIPSRTVKKEEEEEEESDSDWDDDEDEMEQLEKELASGSNMDYLRHSLQHQMQNSRDARPVGGVSLFPRPSAHDEDDPIADILDDEDDAFDVSSLNGDDSRPPSRKISGSGPERGMFGGRTSVGSSGGAGGQNSSPSAQLRLSNAGTDLSNTFGTSQWGTTSKVVSTVNPGATQKSMATNKSSDVGGDDDFDSD